MTMADLPTREELVEAGARAALGHAFDDRFWQTDGRERQYPRNQRHAQKMARQDATAIINAILPLVMRGPVEALDDAIAASDTIAAVREWSKVVASVPVYERVTEAVDLLVSARSVRQWAEKIGGG